MKSLIGEGGMGAVWRAEQLTLGADVAVKLMHARFDAAGELRARFDAEARTAASLRSPHVVQVYDFGVDPETSAPFIVMELLEGESLRERLSARGTLAPKDLLRVLTHVARALTKAHEQNVVHRDLKPANIFLVPNGDSELAKVLDFGIAKRATAAEIQRATATGTLLGTPHYMSPEQIRSAKDVDHHTDLWSLAVIAVECLTGKLPFDADNIAGLALVISERRGKRPSELGRVPAHFDAWFERATHRERSQRFQSATELVNALREACEQPPEIVDATLGDAPQIGARPEPDAAVTLKEPASTAGAALVPTAPAGGSSSSETFGAATSPLGAAQRRNERSRATVGVAVLAGLVVVAAGTWALRSREDVTVTPELESASRDEPSRADEPEVAAVPVPRVEPMLAPTPSPSKTEAEEVAPGVVVVTPVTKPPDAPPGSVAAPRPLPAPQPLSPQSKPAAQPIPAPQPQSKPSSQSKPSPQSKPLPASQPSAPPPASSPAKKKAPNPWDSF